MDDFGCINELNSDFNSLSNSINDLNNTIGMNNCVNNAYDAGELNGLQGFGLISKQYQALIILLIILYWWTTQYTANYFMNSNSQLICNVSCVLDKLVDNAVENCSKCCGNSDTAGACDRKHHKHRKHRCRCNCCCDSDCDDAAECCC